VVDLSALNRRQLLQAIPAIASGAVAVSCQDEERVGAADRIDRSGAENGRWQRVREQFAISPEIIDMSALLVASHPRPVRDAVEKYRRALDENPTIFLENNNSRLTSHTLEEAAKYIGGREQDIALTDSTTVGLGLVYNGFRLRPGEEFVITAQNYYSTDEAVRLSAFRSGADVRTIHLFENIDDVSADQLVENLVAEIGPSTRVLALTWVHSSTGLKLPIARMAEAVREINAHRETNERVLLCVDGVHGFGVENVEMSDLGCDFFIAGCHKWLFGPRGTGIIWGNDAGWGAVMPTIPTFRDASVRRAWIAGADPGIQADGARMTPGGFKPFEHQWALAEAFEFHQTIGKARVEARTHELARQVKEGLAAMPHVRLYTPLSEELSSGIVCFDIEGMSQSAVVSRLRERQIAATTTPYAPSYARITPSIRNTPEEVEAVLREIRELG
jgi:isopenicillin-N epimerase